MKKGLIKIGVIGFLSLFLFGIIAFSLFSSAYSNIPEERGNSVIFDFKSNNTYPLDTVLRLDFTKLGNYKLIINSPSKEVISRVSSNDNFLLKLEEEGEYSVVVQRGNGKKVYYFFVISSGQESPEEQKLNPEDPVQEKAEINKPVEWTQTISEENLTNLIEIPPVINLTLTDKTGEEISYTLTNIDGKNYINLTESLSENISGELKIEYTTEPPKIEETIISNTTKEVVVSSLEGLNYKNVLSYTYLPREIYSKSSIKIYWKENNTYLDFNASDTNGNGLFDYVEWITPHLSSQTFEIIVIIKAEHLDSNKNFISDIYEQVKEKDNLWSEEIREGEYVRVTFEVPLDSTRDITLFPRIISGNPIVEVYEKDKNELIAQFDNLISNEYNKVYLTNLQSQQDIFDLKVVGGILEFDHIIDPNFYARTGVTYYYAGTPTQITFSTAMPDTNYSILFSGQQDTDAVFSIQYDNKATTGFRINRVHDDRGANESAGIEWAALSFGEFDFQNISVKCNSGSGSSTSVINFESSFPDTNYAVVAYTPWDSDSPRVSYSSKSTGSWNSVILDDGGALEAVSSIDWCAVSYGTETIGGIIIKAGSDTASGPTSKVIQLGSSFPDTNYVVVTTASRTGTADPCEIEVSGKTTTSFTVTAEDDDTINNCNGREFNWIAISTGEFFLDLTNPTFISIPENTSIFYENESLGVDFDAIDETGFGYYSVNDTRFSINQSGFLTNSTSLSGGNYLLNISINDTSNNLNWTLYSLEVKKFSLPCFVYFNTSSPVTYPETFRVYTNCSSNHNLFMNGTQILNNSIIDSGAGYYNFTSERQENENYTYIFHQREFIVLKNPEICEIFFNETSPINYPATFQVWANCTSPFTLYRNGTEILNNSEQKLAAGTYNFSMFRLDSQNFSYTYDYSYFTIDELLDVTPPYFTQIPNNASLFYKNQSLGVNFDATDNINFGFYKINDTRFSINQTGYLSNSTSLAAGNYAINVSINDSSNNINWTIYTVQVNKSTFYDCGVYFNTLSPITYPETFIVYTNCSSAYTIYRNGTSIPNNSIINSGAGYYNITVQRTDTQNYTNFFSSEFFIVNKGTPTATLSSSAGWELTYPTSTTISSTNHLQGDSDLIYRIYRNNTNINTGETITLGAGFYNYILNTTGGANYTSHSNLDTENLIIQKNTEQFKVQFNTSSPITYPETFRVYTNSTSPFRLYRDGIIISNNSEQKLGVGSYNFSAYRTDTLNYSFSYTDSFFTINKNPEICQVLFNVSSPIDSTETFRVWANCTSSFNLYRNGTLIPNNSEQSLVYGVYNFSMLRTDTQNYTAYYNETEMVITDSVSPLIDYVFPTPENNSNSSQNWIYLNVSVVEKNLKNITFNLYYINNTLKNSTTFTDSSRSINLTSLEDNSYLFNVTIFDIVGNYNFTETRRINLDTIPPEVNLLSGNYLNFSGTLIPFLNFSVDDLNEISNCTLYGDWAGGWHINETFLNPQKKTSLSFYNKEMVGEGHYLWNVLCYDNSGNFAFNSTNFTFAAFFFPESPNSSLITISQTNDDGTGEVIIDWEPANHSDYYKIYYTDDLKEEFSFLAQTNKTNYVDNFANSTRRRFYKLSNWNPTGENFSNIALGKTVYYLKRKDEINNKNWLGFYLNNSNLDDANNSLNFINNITAFTMWNSTLQRKVTCNEFSCPNFPSCTETNCNFNLQEGAGYEVNLNPHSSEFTNWSLVGTVKDKVNIMLFTNLSSSTFYGKNWISLYANSSLEDAFDLINNISYADSVTNWNEFSQISEGYIKNNYSSMPPYFGLNFVLEPEKGYEVSVTQDSLYTQS